MKRTYHIAEQSKLTSNHLWGLKLNESAYSTPDIKCRYSGHIKAAPENYILFNFNILKGIRYLGN